MCALIWKFVSWDLAFKNKLIFNSQRFKPYNPNLSINWVISICSAKHLCKWLENVMGKQSSTQFFWFMITNRCQKMNRVLIVSPINQQKCNDAHSQGFWCENFFIVWSHIKIKKEKRLFFSIYKLQLLHFLWYTLQHIIYFKVIRKVSGYT